MIYLLDTNTFIKAKNDFYAYDIVPAFWQVLLEKFLSGSVKVIDAVFEELLKGNDNLTDWVKKNISDAEDVNGQGYIVRVKYDKNVINNYKIIANKVYSNKYYSEENKQHFLSVADPWLVAAASTYGDTVVTFEKLAGANTRKIKIPDICQQMNVSFINLYEMMRNIQIKI